MNVEELKMRIDRCRINLEDLRAKYDVCVVGAGPSGALLAAELARCGLMVLLVDKSHFPRHKICGCCLSQAGIEMLHSAGIVLPEPTGSCLSALDCFVGETRFSVKIPRSRAISRDLLDSTIILFGAQFGLSFLPGATARLVENSKSAVEVKVAGEAGIASISCRVLVVADGIAGTCLPPDKEHLQPRYRKTSRVGIGCLVDSAAEVPPCGCIQMYYHPEGYLGAVRLEDGRVNMAAAIETSLLRRAGSAGAVEQILSYNNAAGIRPPQIRWQGTAQLTRHRSQLWDERVFVIGDAAGYIEPFTGEGMTNAIYSARLVLPMVLRAARDWHDNLGRQWQQQYNERIAKRQQICKWTTNLLHNNGLASTAARMLQRHPRIADFIASKLHRANQGGVSG